MIGFEDLPRGLPRHVSGRDVAPRALWVPPEKLVESKRWSYSTSAPLIGQDRQGRHICLDDDRHLLTVAGSRAGKGVLAILPNLATYEGSVLVLDPKGENATLTAERRGTGRNVPAGGLGHDIYVIDPFDVAGVPHYYRAGFNPLAGLNTDDAMFVDQCDSIADALVVAERGKENDHWSSSARLVLRGFIAWVASRPKGKRDLVEVYLLLHLNYWAKDFNHVRDQIHGD